MDQKFDQLIEQMMKLRCRSFRMDHRWRVVDLRVTNDFIFKKAMAGDQKSVF